MSKTRLPQTITLVGLLALSLHTAFASEITLDEAIQHALQHSPVLQGSKAGMQSADEQYKTVRAGRLPRIDVSYDALYSDNPLASLASKLNTRSVTAEDFQPGNINNPASFDTYKAGLSVEVPLYTGGRLTAETDEAAATSESAELRHDRTRSTIVYEVSRAYLYAQAAKQAKVIARSGAQAAKRHVATTSKLLNEGRTVTADKLTAEVYFTSVSSAVQKADSQYKQALNALKQVTGMDLAADLDVNDWNSNIQLDTLPDVDEAEQIAITNRADLKASLASIRAAKARTRKAKSSSLPQFSVVGMGDLYGSDPLTDEGSWAVLARARMNLYSGGANKTRISAARYDRIRLESERADQLATIRREVRDAYAAREEGEQRLKLANSNLKTAREAVRQVNERYGEGRTILIDLLQSEQALLNSRTEWLNASLRQKEGGLTIRHAMDSLAATTRPGDAS
jgi:outer membrane protein TolC